MTVDPTYYQQVIQDCVAWVESRGTAFFISSDLLLTCTHVVKGQTEVTLRRFGTNQDITATVLPGGLPVDEGDLTLLQVADPAVDQPAVLLHMLGPRDLVSSRDVIMAGFPRDDWALPGGYEAAPARIHARLTTTDVLDMLIVETPSNVAAGLSGSPMLDLATGTVIGITRYRSGRLNDTGTGGGAIPVARAVEHFPRVQTFYQQPPKAASVWLDPHHRSTEQLYAIGREPRGTTGHLDLRLSGALDEWCVRVDGVDNQSDADVIRLDVLGVNVTRAVFQWARGRRTSSREDLQLVGEILSAALLHGQVGERYRQWRDASDELTIRLIADAACGDLADLPWEYANPPARGGVCLGVDEKLAIARVMPGTGPDLPAPALGDPVRVAALAVQPDPTTYPSHQVPGGLVTWPDVGTLETTIQELIRPPFQVRDVLCNPARSRVEELRSKGPFQILHYQGFAEVTAARIALALYDDSTGRLKRIEISEFADIAQAVGATLVVIEAHAADASDFSVDDPALRIAAPLLNAGVKAVLTTRSPVHPSQARLFNTDFYAALATGATIERAAQAGRRKVNFDDAFGDQTSFGAFVLWTGETAGLRLTIPAPSQSLVDMSAAATPLGAAGLNGPAGQSRPGPEMPRDSR